MMNEEEKMHFVEGIKSQLTEIDALNVSERTVAFDKLHAQLEETLSTIDGL
ncbi:unannotated protein [freshwater metagenome]|uniref:Unannotated protein n=1 Tax=freshwater metagenome TaxID=449393 RepID=A0A6J6Q168_9ZZZZ|nr:hypothetical protein [Actinomycetota bacterium]MSV86835.1 hypothetical protein [Actinomycetota bacterium]MSW68203.1 hypothetical protein [Actinomycetota bacterium]MSY03960.1 hypothetical protein [Actinomycetota bacterium]MSZ85850.1 hypothetical protein [Actinomycetota bacterium]